MTPDKIWTCWGWSASGRYLFFLLRRTHDVNLHRLQGFCWNVQKDSPMSLIYSPLFTILILKKWFCLRSLEDKRHFLPHKTSARPIFKNIFRPVLLTSTTEPLREANRQQTDPWRSTAVSLFSQLERLISPDETVDLTMCLHSDGWRSIESCSDLDWQFTSTHKRWCESAEPPFTPTHCAGN